MSLMMCLFYNTTWGLLAKAAKRVKLLQLDGCANVRERIGVKGVKLLGRVWFLFRGQVI
jgi:hypothetical protein